MVLKFSFTNGNVVRNVVVEGKKIRIISSETDYEVFEIDLNKINPKDKRFNGMEKIIREISQLNTEEEIMEDIENDWIVSGFWRMK